MFILVSCPERNEFYFHPLTNEQIDLVKRRGTAPVFVGDAMVMPLPHQIFSNESLPASLKNAVEKWNQARLWVAKAQLMVTKAQLAVVDGQTVLNTEARKLIKNFKDLIVTIKE